MDGDRSEGELKIGVHPAVEVAWLPAPTAVEVLELGFGFGDQDMGLGKALRFGSVFGGGVELLADALAAVFGADGEAKEDGAVKVLDNDIADNLPAEFGNEDAAGTKSVSSVESVLRVHGGVEELAGLEAAFDLGIIGGSVGADFDFSLDIHGLIVPCWFGRVGREGVVYT